MRMCDVTFPVLNMTQFHVGSVPGLYVQTQRTHSAPVRAQHCLNMILLH